MWQPCHSDEWLSAEAERHCEMSTRAAPKSKRTVRLARHESQLSHPITAVQRQLKRLRLKTSGRRRSSPRIRHDGKEQPGVSAWWASQAPMAFRAEPLWSESTLLQSSPLKHSSRTFFSPSLTIILRVWENLGWQKTLSWNEHPPLPSLLFLPIKCSQSHSLMAFAMPKLSNCDKKISKKYLLFCKTIKKGNRDENRGGQIWVEADFTCDCKKKKNRADVFEGKNCFSFYVTCKLLTWKVCITLSKSPESVASVSLVIYNIYNYMESEVKGQPHV